MNVQDFLDSNLVKQPYCVLIGHPVSHSLSPFIQNTAAGLLNIDWKYEAVDIAPGELHLLDSIFRNDLFCGANITLPYKQSVIPFVDELDSLSEQLEAVNTVFKKGSKLYGTNTDVYGFKKPLSEVKDKLKGNDAIVFGTGGASRAAVFALNRLGIRQIILVSRSPNNSKIMIHSGLNSQLIMTDYDRWTDYAYDSGIIVNATPLGMSPDTHTTPIAQKYEHFLNHKICYDIVYQPQDTLFLQQARNAGGTPIGGLDMLIYQGGKSFESWTGLEFPFHEVKKALTEYLYGKH